MRWLCPFLLLTLPMLAIGCGSPSDTSLLDMGGADGTKIAAMIEDLNDAKGAGKKFAAQFVKGNAPTGADARKYPLYSFYIIGKPTVTGTEATAKVSVQSDKESKEIGQMEWGFTKIGDAWLLKSAPLP